jgi:hypothetical protein
MQRAPHDDAREVPTENELPNRFAAAPHDEGSGAGGRNVGLVKEARKNVRVLKTVIIVRS